MNGEGFTANPENLMDKGNRIIKLFERYEELRELLNEEGVTSWTSTERIEEYYRAKNMSDVLFTEPWITFDDYFLDGCEELSWSFDDLLKSKETMKFDEKGELIWGD